MSDLLISFLTIAIHGNNFSLGDSGNPSASNNTDKSAQTNYESFFFLLMNNMNVP